MITLEVKNYKLIKDKTIDFDFGNLYLISGKNNIGKTSLKTAFEAMLVAVDSTPSPLSTGELSGAVNLYGFVGPKGEEITIHRTIEQGKDVFFLKNNGKIVKSVTEIRDYFKYTSFSVQEFVNLGLSAEGRRKQRNYLLDILKQEDKLKFFEFEDKEKELTETRKNNKKVLDTKEKLRKENELKEDEIKILSEGESIIKVLQSLLTKFNNIDSLKKERDLLLKSKPLFRNTINNAINSLSVNLSEQTIIELDNITKIIEKQYDEEIEKISDINDEEIEKLKARIENGNRVKQQLENIKVKSSKLDDYTKDKNEYESLVNKNNINIEKLREDRALFMKNLNIPIDNLEIGNEDEGLLYRTNEGLFIFNEKQLSKSLIYKITIDIMRLVNKKSNILVIGDTTDLDTESKTAIANYALEHNLLIIGDTVNDNPELDVVIFSNNGKTLPEKTDTKEKIKEIKEIKQENNTKDDNFLF